MIIYKHNLAEKLFGFAYSKEFLRENTDLCGFVDDPNLSLDIDLAVEFHKALRSDPIAAEKVTNLLILSSSYIDVSTAEFYTDKMKTYPVFDDHINRINDIFDIFVSSPNIPKVNPNNLPDDERERELIGRYINEELKKIEKARTVTTTATTNPSLTGATVIISDNTPTTPNTIFTKVTPISSEGLPYEKPEKILYERVSIATGYSITQLQDIAFNSNFNSALSNALSDCLNSPCNLFSETSDSIASLANTHSMMNSTTMPTWGDLKNNFFNALGGVPDTVFKKVPMSIKNSIIELGQIGQKAVEQSTELFFAFKEEDKAKKQKIIDKAKSGQSLNTDSEGYKYLPDLDSYLNLSKISSNILTKAAEDLGGCFSKFEQAHRYEPYNPEHNKSITSKEPTNNKVGDDQVKQNTLSKTNNDYKYRKDGSMSSQCDYSEPGTAEGSGTKTSTSAPGSKIFRANGSVDPKEVYDYLIQKGLTENQALGIMANIYGESGFQPGLTELGGTGIGLFQYTYPSRKNAFLGAVPDYRTNWKGQIDYVIDSDPETTRYLSSNFSSPEAAAQDFMVNWERPAQSVRANRTVKHNKFINDFKSDN
jgi:hypothetical protein